MLKRIINRIRNIDSEKEYRLKQGLKLGKNSYVNSWDGIDAMYPWLIAIGNDVVISSDVTILAHDASTCRVGCHTKIGRVNIGNNVFIGAKSIVLCNTNIGDNVIVGAGSVVTKDLESNAVYAGNPAVRICSFEEYKQKNQIGNAERPYLSEIRRWDDWHNATDEEKERMIELLSDGYGYI